MTHPEKLQQWLDEHQRTQVWLAEQLGTRQAAVSRWLTCGRKPNLRNAIAIEQLTGGQVPANGWA